MVVVRLRDHFTATRAYCISAGDASQVAGGAIAEELKFWFDVCWTERVRRGCKLPASDPDFIHINVMEFVVVLIQLAACITALETDYAKSRCSDTLPQIPHLWVWSTDNRSSKSWANRLTIASPKAQPLLGIPSHGRSRGTMSGSNRGIWLAHQTTARTGFLVLTSLHRLH
jgi:hypothetical protein